MIFGKLNVIHSASCMCRTAVDARIAKPAVLAKILEPVFLALKVDRNKAAHLFIASTSALICEAMLSYGQVPL